MHIAGILFDIGDTLLGATKIQERALKGTVQALKDDHWLGDRRAFISAYRTADRDPEFKETSDLNHLYSDPRIIRRAFELLSRPVDERRVIRLLKMYRERVRRDLRPNSALIRLLSGLQARGVKLGIVSNGTTTDQMEQLERLQIKQFFDPIVISQQVGVRKPNPSIFLQSIKSWRLRPANVLVVGDRTDWDVIGAHRAGMKSALTTQFVQGQNAESAQAQPDYVLTNLSELPRILDDEPAPSSR
jgi:putative hydrolase of the HAD superfamily